MSSAALKGIISSLQAGRVAISAGTAAAALVIYDFFLTLSSEQNHIWQPKRTLVFYIFNTLRYATLAYQITFNLAFFLPIKHNASNLFSPSEMQGCAAIIYVEQVCFIFSSAALSGVFLMRTFAIYERNWIVFVVLFFVAAVKIFVSATDFFVSAKVAATAGAFARFASCSETIPASGKKWNTASASLALLFDTIVVFLTVAKTIQLYHATRKAGMKKGYTYFILRDGLLYYFTIEILLLCTVIFNQIPSVETGVARVVIILQTSLAPILGQRLVLNLKAFTPKAFDSDSPRGVSDTVQQELSGLQFAQGSVIGNIGAPLRMSFATNRDDDYDDDSEQSRTRQGDLGEMLELKGFEGAHSKSNAEDEEKHLESPGIAVHAI
ncbi:hypothetical protein BD410DRAFT_899740 [Rickenella mellea]|uniref:DUF6533 domain-containing protein n=1 Tax=Rickenella mellea TaxID=50990 RepID=A0A4Y7PYE6_9AGAM|nr:hypothetical protein BD410DRAFT_899740 [Rickenella mellea]